MDGESDSALLGAGLVDGIAEGREEGCVLKVGESDGY